MGSLRVQGGFPMSAFRLLRACSAIGLALLSTGCAGWRKVSPPPANPFLTDAPPLASTTLAQPAKVGLIWLAQVVSAVPSQAAPQKLVDKVKGHFAAGNTLATLGATLTAAPLGRLPPRGRKCRPAFRAK